MFSTEDGIPLCIVEGGKSDGEIIFIKTEDDKKNSIIRYEPVRMINVIDGIFQQIPSENVRVLYVAGPSGSGKSTWTGNYVEAFKNVYPKAKFFLFSRMGKDEALDFLKPHRITLTDELVENPIELEEVEDNSILVFDDIDTISNVKLLKSILNFQSQVLEMGRHKNIKIIITSHLINGNDKKQTRTILNEMQCMVIFPQSGSAYQIKYVLKQYFGLSNTQIRNIMNTKSRWVSIIKNYPQIMLTETECIFVSEIK